jgi:DNA-binding transcriptional regulator GbsR (MarR family)
MNERVWTARWPAAPVNRQKAQTAHVDRFIEQLGRLAEGEGLPRTAGRMMGLLIVSGIPLGIDEIAARLQVSRASVSTNSRLLQSLSIAQLVSAPGNRRDYLQISGDPCSSLLALGLQRMQSMHQAVRQMRLATNGAEFKTTRTRLRRMEKFYAGAVRQVQAVLENWNERRPEARR